MIQDRPHNYYWIGLYNLPKVQQSNEYHRNPHYSYYKKKECAYVHEKLLFILLCYTVKILNSMCMVPKRVHKQPS